MNVILTYRAVFAGTGSELTIVEADIADAGVLNFFARQESKC